MVAPFEKEKDALDVDGESVVEVEESSLKHFSFLHFFGVALLEQIVARSIHWRRAR